MGRDYDEFNEAKIAASSNIDINNAAEILQETKSKLLKKLRTLDVQNLTQVEDLYLIVAPLTQAASYVAAQDKADRKNQSFDDALASIGTDDVISILKQTFKGQSETRNFSKFNDIEKNYRPAKQAWAGLHARMDTIAIAIETEARQQTTNSLKVTIPQYLAHLEKKLKDTGITLPIATDSQKRSSKLEKLIARYHAIETLNNTLTKSSILSKDGIKQAKEAVQTCLNNKPDWSERSFLQKLTDVLSLGFKPLYRAFTSKENNYQATINNTIDPPKM